jgi:hypothetical protein
VDYAYKNGVTQIFIGPTIGPPGRWFYGLFVATLVDVTGLIHLLQRTSLMLRGILLSRRGKAQLARPHGDLGTWSTTAVGDNRDLQVLRQEDNVFSEILAAQPVKKGNF